MESSETKLKKLFLIEAIVALLLIIVIVAIVEITPYLETTKQNASIGLYQSRDFGKGNITIERGERIEGLQFNYTTYDPAILQIDLSIMNCQIPGILAIACNGKVFASVFLSSEESIVSLTAITFSGAEWVEPFYIYSRILGNEISFSSDQETGYEGTFTYQIKIRGSR